MCGFFVVVFFVSGVFVCAAGDGKVGDCALITPVYLEIALFSGAKDGATKARYKTASC